MARLCRGFAITAKRIWFFGYFRDVENSIKFKPSSTPQESSMSTVLPESVTQARSHDLAKAEAVRLRRVAVDAFWRGGDPVREVMLDQTQRSAQRLAYRLARHRRERTAAASITSTGA
jgi:hypothetical protein